MCWDKACPGSEVNRQEFLAGSAALVAGITTEGAGETQDPKPPTRVLDNPTIQHGKVTFTHNGKEVIDGFLARPKADGKYPGVLVIAGNRITEEYIPNTCAALAVAGYVGLAPNIFHPLTTETGADINKALQNHTEFDVLLDIQMGADYLRTQPFVRDTGLGIIGFCFGGRMALLFGARNREIEAVVPFHPGPVKENEIRRLTVPVQIHHGTADRAVGIETSRKTEQMLRARKTPVEVFAYEGADHGFLAYTRPFYKPDEARLAWERTIAFLNRHLKG